MHRHYYILMFFLLLFVKVNACQHEFSPGTDLIDGENILPGDTVCLLGGNWNGLQLRNIHGSSELPVVVMNKSGVVLIESEIPYGVKFSRCSDVILSGNGQPQFEYGIKILSVDHPAGTGISIDNKSTDVELAFLEIANVQIGGIYAKTEPDYFMDCSFTAVRDSFTMYNTSIHDCYLHDIGNEGMYVGSSKYTGQTIYHCNDTVVYPHVLKGVRIYNNKLENIGWDGIQVSSAVEDCEIYNNLIINNSTAEEEFQMSGVLIGGGSNCDCYNNKIIGGKGGGIEYLGFGNNRIYNNLIVRPGENYHPGEPPLDWQKHGIWVGDVVTQANSDLLIQNNTIISPRSFGIKLSNSSIKNYMLQNNLIVEPGAYDILGEDAFINTSLPGLLTQSNNLLTKIIDEVAFLNPQEEDYDLQPDSPAVNSGLSLAFDFDLENRPRPFDEKYDIGAYECQDSSLLSVNEMKLKNYKHGFQPNPFSSVSDLCFTLQDKEAVIVRLYDVNGTCIYSKTYGSLQAGKHRLSIPADKLKDGWVVYEIATSSNILRGKAVKRTY